MDTVRAVATFLLGNLTEFTDDFMGAFYGIPKDTEKPSRAIGLLSILFACSVGILWIIILDVLNKRKVTRIALANFVIVVCTIAYEYYMFLSGDGFSLSDLFGKCFIAVVLTCVAYIMLERI